jgi:hypothetical protein
MSEGATQDAGTTKGINWRLVALTAVLLAFTAAEYWRIFIWEGTALQKKVTVVLAIIGAYGIALGFIRKNVPENSLAEELVGDLTSPNPALCWGTNFIFLGMITSMLSVGLSTRKATPQPAALMFLSSIVLIAMALGLVAYAIFHALVVVPIAYPAILVAASVVNAFETAAGDSLITVTSQKQAAPVTFSLKAVALKDKVATASFVMGLPAAVLALFGAVFAPFL